MCGIFGVIFRDSHRSAQTPRVTAARDSLIHRGPDEAGLWSVPGAALGHRRLKVLDLTHGQQPLVDPAGRFALVYNGEVYNFAQLRERYRQAGAAFTTTCDTEVVFEALNREGPAALDRFNGMFALGHWDNQSRTLLLVRDRLGKKPLYWHADAEQIVFASELKAILVYLDRRFDIDPAALDHFFGRGYIPAPRTIFQGIQKLPAGCLLRADAGPGAWRWEVEPYWDFTPRQVPNDPTQVLDELDELLTDAVRVRLVSDVPIGCLLSGGIDSSLITALAAKVSAEPVKAFSIGFDDSPEHNELPYAKMVAEKHKCRWFSQMVRGGDFMAMLADTAPFIDEPYGNFTVFSMRRLAQLAREQLVVVLSGQGGDELSAGYPGRYNWVLQTPQTLAGAQGGQPMRYAPVIDDLIQHINHSSFVRWTGARDTMFSSGFQDAIQSHVQPAEDVLPFWRRHHEKDRLNNLLYADVKTNLPDYLICLEERLTMSCSLEARNPLLDHRVVDLMLSLPPELKVRDGRNKWVLTELARRYVPSEAIDRPKRGFTPPLEMWMNTNATALAREFQETDGQTAGIYSPQWRSFLLQGRFPTPVIMPAFYSLMLAQWVKHYGRYIGAWPASAPGPGPAGCSITPGAQAATPPTSDFKPWQLALRNQAPAAIADARWFCQAMGNFAPGTSLLLHGDPSHWYAFLARGCGMTIAKANAPASGGGGGAGAGAGQVFIGIESLRKLARGGLESAAASSEETLLIFAPFALTEAGSIQTLLTQLSTRQSIRGYQVTQLSADTVVLIARCQSPTAVAG